MCIATLSLAACAQEPPSPLTPSDAADGVDIDATLQDVETALDGGSGDGAVAPHDSGPTHDGDAGDAAPTPDADEDSEVADLSDTAAAEDTEVPDLPCELAHCAAGFVCRDTVCEDARAAPCVDHSDCGDLWHCLDAECAPRAASVGAPHLVPVDALVSRHSPPRVRDLGGLALGTGGALLDFDGDLDVDVFLGGSPEAGTPPCVYRNVSTPGVIAFEREPSFCDRRWPLLSGGVGLDVDGDGPQELLALGPGAIMLVRFEPSFGVTDLTAALSASDTRRGCNAGSAVEWDVDLDGVPEVVVGCQYTGSSDGLENVVLVGDGAGGLAIADVSSETWARDRGETLALGSDDLDGDGLADLFVINDNRTGPVGGRNPFLDPGGVWFGCRAEGCDAESSLFAARPDSWGSFMGVARVWVDRAGPGYYVTDLGPNRFLFYDGGAFEDRASEYAVALGDTDPAGNWRFSWSAVVDDFDRNGLDDFLVFEGTASATSILDVADGLHADTLFLQTSSGRFRPVDRNEFAPPGPDPRTSAARSSRSAVRVDFDFDGSMELLSMPAFGPRRLETEVPLAWPAPPRCTLVPRSRYVGSHGRGYATRGEHDPPDVWHVRNMGGHTRLSAAPWLLVPQSRGYVRFPSGAVVAYDCHDEAGPVELLEPQWLELEWTDVALAIHIDAPIPDGATVDFLTRTAEGDVERRFVEDLGDRSWRISPPPAAVLLSLDGRWIPRWFHASDTAFAAPAVRRATGTTTCGAGARCADGYPCSLDEECINACVSGVCAVLECNDRFLNGTETDVDCGGSCEPCFVGRSCSAAADCYSDACAAGVCAAVVSCGNDVLDGHETGLDCGGPACAPCPLDGTCASGLDCESGECEFRRCRTASTCDDRRLNGAESDVDCGGDRCPRCRLGDSCRVSGDCFSGLCVDGECAAG